MDTVKVRIISIVAAIITVFCVGYYLQRIEKSKPVETTVIEAGTDIPEGTQITADMLVAATVYQSDLMPSALTNGEDIIGQYASSKIVAGSQIAASMLSDQKASSSASSFSYKIPAGMRTVTLSISQTTSVAGMLQVGDHVDILATYNEQDGENSKTVTKYIAGNVEIAALDQTVVRSEEDASTADSADTSGTQAATTVTMFVSPELAQALVWESQNGSLVLTLRSPEETTNPPADTFSADNMKTFGVDSASTETAETTEPAQPAETTTEQTQPVDNTQSTEQTQPQTETGKESAND